mgnify:CR=1 FL=1
MRVVVQRVKEASVSVSEKIIGLIDHGLVVFVSFVDDDTMDELDWMSKKIINLRIFSDKDDKMNDSLLDVDGNILLISQFTLHASTKKGNRPSFIKAAKPDFAHDMYQKFIKILEEKLSHIKTPVTLSIIGCVVNGPGEAAMTDVGITGGGKGNNMLYLSGVQSKKVLTNEIIDKVISEVEKKALELEKKL